jgi:hypothetical protein
MSLWQPIKHSTGIQYQWSNDGKPGLDYQTDYAQAPHWFQIDNDIKLILLGDNLSLFKPSLAIFSPMEIEMLFDNLCTQ